LIGDENISESYSVEQIQNKSTLLLVSLRDNYECELNIDILECEGIQPRVFCARSLAGWNAAKRYFRGVQNDMDVTDIIDVIVPQEEDDTDQIEYIDIPCNLPSLVKSKMQYVVLLLRE